MNKKRNIKYIAVIGTVLMLFSFCSTKKAGITNRTYHNLTAHYNVWWNGNEAFKEGLKDLNEKAKDNYTQVLPVFKYGTKEEATAQNPKWERGIEKGTKAVSKHSIFIKGKEYCNWIDDSYLLIGKSQFYKQDYLKAKMTFNFIISQYKSNPIKYDAMLWLARLQTQQKEYASAGSLIAQVQQGSVKNEVDKKTKKQINLVLADYYVRQKNYDPAINSLKSAIVDVRNKQMNSRLRFILAQIYQENNQFAEASKYYKSVVKRNPDYEMMFNATMNMASTYDGSNGNPNEVLKILQKMLKDKKNEEYKDQIYYALAEFSMKQKKQDDAVKYYELSVSNSVNNNYQKTASALKLGEIYFDKQNYIRSQQYYDTAITFLPKDYPNYEMVKNRSDILSSLVRDIQTVIVEDSLQAMQAMPESQRLAKVDKAIKEYIAAEEQRKRDEQLEQQRIAARAGTNSNTYGGGQGQSGSWYFYNPSTVNFGYNDFLKKWGKRRLEDKWRLSNKDITTTLDRIAQDQAEAENEEVDSLAAKKVEGVDDPKNRNFYLKDLPDTPEKLAASNERIAIALKNIGYIYYEELRNASKSISSFLEIPRRYPEHAYTPEAYYQVYRIYLEEQDATNKEKYKNIILDKYPETMYAKMIKNPDYYKELADDLSKEKKLYDQVYAALSRKDYASVNSLVARDLKDIQNQQLIPKFLYLNAIAIGKLKGQDSLMSELKMIKNKYPDSEVIPTVNNMLDYLIRNKDLNLTAGSSVASNPVAVNTPAVSPEPVKTQNPAKQPATQPTTPASTQPPVQPTQPTPTTPVTPPVQNPVTPESKPVQTVVPEEKESDFKNPKKDGTHYYVAVVNPALTNLNIIKLKMGDFNRMYFKDAGLSVTHLDFINSNELLYVGKLKNQEQAQIYYNLILKEDYVYKNVDPKAITYFIITDENFQIFFTQKKLIEYLEFFKQNYDMKKQE